MQQPNYPTYNYPTEDGSSIPNQCYRCPPGYRIDSQYSDWDKCELSASALKTWPRCVPCPDGYYSTEWSKDSYCAPQRVCDGPNEVTVFAGTTSQQALCGCESGFTRIGNECMPVFEGPLTTTLHAEVKCPLPKCDCAACPTAIVEPQLTTGISKRDEVISNKKTTPTLRSQPQQTTGLSTANETETLRKSDEEHPYLPPISHIFEGVDAIPDNTPTSQFHSQTQQTTGLTTANETDTLITENENPYLQPFSADPEQPSGETDDVPRALIHPRRPVQPPPSQTPSLTTANETDTLIPENENPYLQPFSDKERQHENPNPKTQPQLTKKRQPKPLPTTPKPEIKDRTEQSTMRHFSEGSEDIIEKAEPITTDPEQPSGEADDVHRALIHQRRPVQPPPSQTPSVRTRTRVEYPPIVRQQKEKEYPSQFNTNLQGAYKDVRTPLDDAIIRLEQVIITDGDQYRFFRFGMRLVSSEIDILMRTDHHLRVLKAITHWRQKYPRKGIEHLIKACRDCDLNGLAEELTKICN